MQDYSVVVIGAGQNGLALAGRLGALGISCLTVDREARVGDSWANRYDSLTQHVITEFSNLPFDRTYPAETPKFVTKDATAEAYRNFAEKYNLHVWLSSKVEACSWGETEGKWTLNIFRAGETYTVKTRHLALCIGTGLSIPRRPDWPNQEGVQRNNVSLLFLQKQQGLEGKTRRGYWR